METPTPEQEAAAKLAKEGESEEQKEFNKLFEGIDLDDENADIEELKQKVADIQKGAAKFFSEKGMKKEATKEDPAKPAVKVEDASDLEVIFFESKPEASLVEDDLKTVAKAKGISLIQAWKTESWIQSKAKALQSEKTEKESNNGRVADPSAEFAKGLTDEQRISKRLSGNLPPGFSAEKPKL